MTFRELSEAQIEWYLARAEWRGRAGAYAIQGAGAALVRSIEGDYENVVGLPVATLLDLYPELLRAEPRGAAAIPAAPRPRKAARTRRRARGASLDSSTPRARTMRPTARCAPSPHGRAPVLLIRL